MNLVRIFGFLIFCATSCSAQPKDSEEITRNLEIFFNGYKHIINGTQSKKEFSGNENYNPTHINDKEIDSHRDEAVVVMSTDNVNDVEISTTKTIENISKSKNFNWIPYESSMGAEYIPVNAVIAGFDINKLDLYVIRTYDVNEESFKVGKYSAYNEYASVLDGNIERKLNSFEILQSMSYEWSDDVHDKENAIIAGHDTLGREIYICRAFLQIHFRSIGFRTSWTPGELRSDGICAVGFDGKIEKFTNYQILKNIKENHLTRTGIDYVDGRFIIDPETSKTLNYFLTIYKQEEKQVSTVSPKLTAFHPQTYKWISWYEKATDIPDDAVIGGRDVDGSLLCVIRIGHKNKHLYGKFAIQRQNAYVANEQQEFGVVTFELLTAEKYLWCNKIKYNIETDLPICRVNIMRSIIPGFLQPNEMCRIGFEWKSHEYKDYEILKIGDHC